jgi:hypothetical protein
LSPLSKTQTVSRSQVIVMEYVEWCELVLQVMGKAAEESAQVRNYGIDCESLGKRIWGEHYATVGDDVNAQERDNILYDAICDLDRNLLIDDPNATFIKLTREGRKAAKNLFPVWENACGIRLEPLIENALRIINRHSNQPHQYFGRANFVPMNTVHCELDEQDLTEEDVWELLAELKALDLTYWDGGEYPEEVRSTYRGLTWETRRDRVSGVRFELHLPLIARSSHNARSDREHFSALHRAQPGRSIFCDSLPPWRSGSN